MRRRLLILLGALLAFGAGVAVGCAQSAGTAQAPAARQASRGRMWADVLLDTTTDQIPRRVRLHVHLDHWDPSAETGVHTHPGPTVIVVLEGELSESTRSRTNALTAGHAYWRPADEEHNVRNITERPARALAVHLDPAGS